VIQNDGTATAFPYDDGVWNGTVACIADRLAPYDIEITEVEPAAGPYNEIVMTGSGPTDFGLTAGIFSNNPFNCGNLLQYNIVMLFSGISGDTAAEQCDVAAFSVGKLAGLDNVMTCQDPVTFLSGCTKLGYQDLDMNCGEFTARDCLCGGTTQENHHQLMLERLGQSCD